MNQSLKIVIQIIALLSFILVVGTAGYTVIEDGWTVGDGFYMTVITITTVGFGEVHDLSQAGRAFTVVIIFLGFGVVGVLGSQLAKWIIDTEFNRVFGKGKMAKRITNLEKHYIICGYGSIGSTICVELQLKGYPFVIIENNDDLVTHIEKKDYCVVEGNATTDEALREAGIERAAGVIATLRDDADNLFISLAARELNPKILIIARGEEPGIEDRILRAGADIAVSPLKLGGQQIAHLIAQHTAATSDVLIDEPMSSLLGYSLRLFRQAEGYETTVGEALKKADALLALAVKHEDGSVDLAPNSRKVICAADSVIMFAKDGHDLTESILKRTDSRNVLLVDDNRAQRMLFAKKIRSAGHEVILAGSGDEAINLAQETKPDLIVLDVKMPGKSGYEVCRAVKHMPDLKDIPVILYSADETDEFKRKGRESGADVCLQKTSRSSELLVKIEELLVVE